MYMVIYVLAGGHIRSRGTMWRHLFIKVVASISSSR